MSDSRLEKFIYAICSMDVTDLPVPLSRIEKLWNCLITGETPDFEPLSRNEKYLMAMLDRYDISNLPAPMSRGEKLLYKIAVGETDLSDVPGYLSRYEELLKYLIENGGISGGDFEYVLHTINQSLYTLYTTAEKPVKSAVIYGDTLVNTLQESSTLAVTPMGEEIDASQATVTGTANGAIKSAILKGNTLVNLAQSTNLNGEYVFRDNFENLMFPCNMIKPSTTYTIVSNIIENSANFLNLEWSTTLDECAFKEVIRADGSLGIRKFKVTSKDDLSNASISIRFFPNNKQENGTLTITFMILEGDYTNIDIPPYFEGMQSVKMPGVTMVGKNLFPTSTTLAIDRELGNNGEIINGGGLVTKEYIPLTFFEQCVFSSKASWLRIAFYDIDKKFISLNYEGNVKKLIFTPPSGAKFFRVSSGSDGDARTPNELQYQIEQGSVATSYEPYKTNILTTSEEVELRGIGDVKDELDCSTSELI